MTTSLWQATATKTAYPPLSKNFETEIVVVGGGITGVSTAYHLQKAGFKVILAEAHHIGSGVTGKTTAHLTTAVDATYNRTVNKIGVNEAKLLAEAAQEAIHLVEHINNAENLEANFKRLPAYQYAATPDQVKELEDERDAARTAGLPVEWLEEAPNLPFTTYKSIKFPVNAQFHPLKYTYALAKRVVAKGGTIVENTRITKFNLKGEKVVLETSHGSTITADKVVYATHIPLGIDPLQTMNPPYRSYALSFKSATPPADALYYDMHEPYHYLRPAEYNGEQVWVAGGADHKTGAENEQQHLQKLRDYVKQRFSDAEIVHEWSAQVYEPIDGLPYIGESLLQPKSYVATGFSGDGTLWGSLAAKMIKEMISGKKSPYQQLFAPARANVKSGVGDFIKANAEVAWHFLADRFVAEADEVREVPRGEGMLVQQDGKQYAVYRNDGGELHVMSATCTHMGCKVNWNKLEKSWDCPCHGARYSPTGEVIEGPARHSLKGKSATAEKD